MDIRKLYEDIEELVHLSMECTLQIHRCDFKINKTHTHKEGEMNYIDELNMNKSIKEAHEKLCFIKSRIFCYFVENKNESKKTD
jgi:hypothetical protein